MRRPALLLLLLSSVGCANRQAVGKVYLASDVQEAPGLPSSYEVGESLRATCTRAPRNGSFRGVPLSNVDCNAARLSRVLRARAGERGALLIVGKHCKPRGRARLECVAQLATPTERVALRTPSTEPPGPAPSPAQVADLDEPAPQNADRIRVAFTPTGAPARREPRRYDAVAETARPSVGRREIGRVEARCDEGCDDQALRHALRVTGGHVGAGEVSSIQCVHQGNEASCFAVALEPWSS